MVTEKLPTTTQPVRISQYSHRQLLERCARNGMKVGMMTDGIIQGWLRGELYKAPPPIKRAK